LQKIHLLPVIGGGGINSGIGLDCTAGGVPLPGVVDIRRFFFVVGLSGVPGDLKSPPPRDFILTQICKQQQLN